LHAVVVFGGLEIYRVRVTPVVEHAVADLVAWMMEELSVSTVEHQLTRSRQNRFKVFRILGIHGNRLTPAVEVEGQTTTDLVAGMKEDLSEWKAEMSELW